MFIRLVFLVSVLTLSFVSPVVADDSEKEESSAQELSLKQDREALNELRKDIPEDVKRENDDLAFILKLFDDKSRKPGRIRSQFNKIYNRTRKQKQREFKQERKEYTRAEKKRRKAYLSEAKKKRKAFLATDADKEAKKEFFADERTARRDFFSDEKEKRKDFESDIRARQKEFDNFLKDRRKDFDDRFRQFKKEQKAIKDRERKRRASSKRGAAMGDLSGQLTPENKQYLEDFKKIPKRSGLTLEPADSQWVQSSFESGFLRFAIFFPITET